MATLYPDLHLLTTALLLTALVVSLLILGQIITTYSHAYLVAPSEIHTFIDTVSYSIQENESYDKDVAKVPRLEDKLRLGKLLREIQKGSDDLREDLDRMLVGEEEGSGNRVKNSTRVMWAIKRKGLEERVRRLDMLRMRFLVVYMGLVAAKSQVNTAALKEKDGDKSSHGNGWQRTPVRPAVQHALTERPEKEENAKRVLPPVRRLTTQAIGHGEVTGGVQKLGWLGVIAELQKSPLMHRRHASVENSLASPGAK